MKRIAAIFALMTFNAAAAFFEVAVPPSSGDKYTNAEYRLWIPDGLKDIRCVIAKQHGCGDPAATHGLDHANDPQWQALAKKHNCALLGTRLWTRERPCSDWADPANGSGAAFLNALEQLSAASRHPELRETPWVLWGHSGGAFWSTSMLAKHPERVVAVIAVRGGELINVGPQVIAVPVLWAIGAKDEVTNAVRKPTDSFNRYRPQGAPWTLAVEANAGHETGDTRFLAIPYLDTLLPRRLAKPGRPLRPIGTLPGSTVSWVPDFKIMKRFIEYQNLGIVHPRDDPDDPQNVQLTRGADGLVISWKYQPDLYDGFPSFRVERDGQVVHTLSAPRHSYGDAPLSMDGSFEFRLTNAPPGAKVSVIAFNALGQETVSKQVK